MHIKSTLFVILLALLISSCASTHIDTHTITPLSQNKYWIDGKEFSVSQSDGVELSAHPSNLWEYEVKIKNIGKTTIILSHENFSIVSDSAPIQKIKAQDPELVLKKFDDRYDANLNQENVLNLNQFMTDVKGINSNRSETDKLSDMNNTLNNKSSLQKIESENQSILDAKIEKRKILLKKNTIRPNESVSGLISFSELPAEGPFSLVLDIQEKKLNIPFELKKTH